MRKWAAYLLCFLSLALLGISGHFLADYAKQEEKADILQEQLKDPEFKKEWDDIQPEMDVIRAMIDARIEQNLTQKELAARTGIDQADISKLENGTRNPSLKLLKKLASGLGMQLKIEFVPMQTLQK